MQRATHFIVIPLLVLLLSLTQSGAGARQARKSGRPPGSTTTTSTTVPPTTSPPSTDPATTSTTVAPTPTTLAPPAPTTSTTVPPLLNQFTQLPTLSWAPPTLTSPSTVVITDSTPYWLPTFDNTRDYRLVLPGMPGNPQTTPLAHGVGITGGHNVVMIGGSINVAPTVTDPEYEVGLKLRQQAGTIHIEGVAIDNASDGINMDERYGAVVQLENLWIHTPYPHETDGFHADCVQTWAGPAQLLIDHLTCESAFQGLFFDPNDPGFQSPAHPTPVLFDLRFVDVASNGSGSGYDYEQLDRSAPYPILGASLFGSNPTGHIVYGPFAPVTVGSPAGGQFVPAVTVGAGYVSPGYP